MSTCLTAEQALKDGQPKLLRNAVLVAIVIHAVAFVTMPRLTVEPYRLRAEGPPPLKPMNFVFEDRRPRKETPKPPAVRQFEPTADADGEATIDPTVEDWSEPIPPVDRELDRRDAFRSFDEPPIPVLRVEPVYPELARQAELEGTVGLLIVIDESGNVESAEVVTSVPGLDEAAVAAVLQWKFEPARQRDVPVRVKVFQAVRFTLR